MYSDIDAFVTLAQTELVTVLRSPLRVGRSDDQHQSSVVVLDFEYCEAEELLRRKFKYIDADVISMVDLIASDASYASLNTPAYRKLNPPPKTPTGPTYIQLTVVFCVRYRVDARRAPKQWTKARAVMPMVVPMTMFGTKIMPLQQRKLLPNWKGYLRRVLSGNNLPRNPQEALWAELAESEGAEVARKARVRVESRGGLILDGLWAA
ncbi:hypothetical protein P7C70_g897, partial [Phenoliferia sp. Uapishka_3]